MPRKIIELFKSNLFSVILNSILVLLTARFLGAEGRGEITIITSLSLILQLLNGVVGSGALYYMLKDFEIYELWFVSFMWFVLISFIGSSLCVLFQIVDYEFYLIIFLYTFLSSGLVLQLMLHIHLNQTISYGIIKVFQPLITIAFMFLNRDHFNVEKFFEISIGAIFTCICFSVYALKLNFGKLDLIRLSSVIKRSLKYGGTSQLSNLAQIVNYRYSFFLLESYVGLAAVGVFSIMFAICEVIWLFCATVSAVVCSEVSKYNNLEKEVEETKKAYKWVFIVTALLVLAALIVPVDVYVFILNEEFREVKHILYYMVPGVLLFAVAKVVAHYFSALGLMKYNLLSSVLGVVILIPIGLFLVPQYGVVGAAITNSISYLVTAFALFYFFKKRTRSSLFY